MSDTYFLVSLVPGKLFNRLNQNATIHFLHDNLIFQPGTYKH